MPPTISDFEQLKVSSEMLSRYSKQEDGLQTKENDFERWVCRGYAAYNF